MDKYRMKPGALRILLPGRTGTVEIDTELSRADGAPRIRVDVISDTPRFGPADDGLSYVVENGDPGPGVVFLTGTRPQVEPEPATTAGPKYPGCTVDLSDVSGNAVAIFRTVRQNLISHLRAVHRWGYAEAVREGDAFQTEATSGDYDHMLTTCQRWVNVI